MLNVCSSVFLLLVYLESHKICKSNFSNTWEKQFLNVCKSNIYRRNLNRAYFDKRKWNFSSNNKYKLTLPSRLQKMQQQEGVEEVLDDVRIRINFRWSFWGELKNSNDDLLIQTQTSDQTFSSLIWCSFRGNDVGCTKGFQCNVQLFCVLWNLSIL